MTTDSWEYLTVPLVPHTLQEILNLHGKKGWELVSVADNVAFFKKPLVTAPVDGATGGVQ